MYPLRSLLRKYSIDELPQLWNVLRGDMSLVGPRPEIPSFVETFREEIPSYMLKHYIRPGMTGLAQIRGLQGGGTSIRSESGATWSISKTGALGWICLFCSGPRSGFGQFREKRRERKWRFIWSMSCWCACGEWRF